jgi:hypothetical protein
MDPMEKLFGLVVRVVGLGLIVFGILAIPNLIFAPVSILSIGLYLGVGAILFGWADVLVNAAYRRDK